LGVVGGGVAGHVLHQQLRVHESLRAGEVSTA
jgi:hypothetical protein